MTTDAGADPRLLDLLAALKARGYRFVAPTPATHRRVLGRRDGAVARDLRDVFGWSLPFAKDMLPEPLFAALQAADLLDVRGDLFHARVRVASLGEDLFIHSAFPPTDEDAVFFGPDTYRFAAFLRRKLAGAAPVRRLLDVGTGSGAGLVAALRAVGAEEALATDINAKALAVCRANLAAAGLHARLSQAEGLSGTHGPLDLIVANPPFIADPEKRTYRDGGGLRGAQVSLEWALSGAGKLAPGGRLLLYTGVAIVGGQDPLRDALAQALDPAAFELDYDEIDPDIFGEQLLQPGYEDVERIAAIGAVISRRT